MIEALLELPSHLRQRLADALDALTEAALDRNIETGLLLRDRTIAATALSYFQGLIDRGRLLVLPAE